MSNTKTTYDLTDSLVQKLVQPIAAGDLAKPFATSDETGRLLSLSDDHLSGRYLVLVFLNNSQPETARAVLRTLAEKWRDFHDQDTEVLAFNSDSDTRVNQRLKFESGFRWPILCDPGGATYADYGLHKKHGVAVRIVLLTPYRQIRCWYDDVTDLNATLETIMTQVTTPILQENAKWYPLHAPVLLVPQVFTREECKQMIGVVESRGELLVSASQGAADKDFKVPIYEHNRQDRIDHVIRDRAMLQFIDGRLGQRVNPLIKKAFAFDVASREVLHIARYCGDRGGDQMGHRDNTTASTAHRKFALSMNLNDDFQGGGIVFREFSSQPYRPEPGVAIIFSSSLLHEVLETTRGTRYSLITHLFGKAAVPS